MIEPQANEEESFDFDAESVPDTLVSDVCNMLDIPSTQFWKLVYHGNLQVRYERHNGEFLSVILGNLKGNS